MYERIWTKSARCIAAETIILDNEMSSEPAAFFERNENSKKEWKEKGNGCTS